MSLRERIFSLETEYAINFYPAENSQVPSKEMMVAVLRETLAEDYGSDGSPYLVNGGKLHCDVGHAEWSLPECRGAREVATYDKAADLTLRAAIPRAERKLASQGYRGMLFVAKNNADSGGHTFGCHENYLMVRDSELLVGDQFRCYLASCLVPFLVTRQILVGSGRLSADAGDHGQQPVYSISQRASFISHAVSAETTHERGILNLGREQEPLASGNYRRLHLIVGDANLSGWATWMKLGTTGIVLRMIEDIFLGDLPQPEDPVAALHAIARDPSCRQRIRLYDQREMTALEIQRHYLECADNYLRLYGASAEEREIITEWDQALQDLDDLDEHPMALANRIDWVMKKAALDRYLAAKRLRWEDLAENERAFLDLCGYELRYHDVSAAGLYSILWQPDTLVSLDECHRARQQAPPYTRASLRGRVVAVAQRLGIPAQIGGWASAQLGEEALNLSDPLEFELRGFGSLLRAPLRELEDAVASAPEDAQCHHNLGQRYERAAEYAGAHEQYRQAVELCPTDATYIEALARAALIRGDYPAASKAQRRANALREQPRQRSYTTLGDAYRYLGRYDEAKRAYLSQIRRTPQQAFAHANLGQLYLTMGDLTAAERSFEAGQRLAPHLVCLVSLGVLFAARGELDEARALYEAALSLPPGKMDAELTPGAKRYFIACALIGCDSPESIAALEMALIDRRPAAAAGMVITPILLTILAGGEHPPRAVADALALVRDLQWPPREPPSAVDADALTPDELARWHAAIRQTDAAIRRRAATYLGWRESAQALPLLDQLARDEDDEVRAAAIKALGSSKREAALQILIDCLLRERNPRLRWEIEDALDRLSKGTAKPPVAVPALPVASDALVQILE